MKINGKEYEIGDLDFTNVLCDLEDRGINIMGMGGKNPQVFSIARGIVSIYTGEKDLSKCGKIISEHLNNGGSINDIIDPFTEAMAKAGFGKKAEETEVTEAVETEETLPETKPKK